MPITTSKEILSKYNLLNPEETKKHARYEFQAFAYKLAADLNDLVNLKMYMRIAKNSERSLVEKAYSFAIDSRSENKGKAFMWKLKDLRLELQRYRDSKNFDYDFVMKRMKLFRNKTANAQIKVYSESKSGIIKFISSSMKTLPKSKVLVVSTPSVELLDNLIQRFKKLHYIDLSKEVNNKLEAPYLENHKKISLKSTDFIKSKFKEKEFKYIVIDSFWNYLPKDSETRFIQKLKEILSNTGEIFISFRLSTENRQEWKDLKSGETLVPYFTKLSTLDQLQKNIASSDFNFELVYNDGVYGIAKITN